MAPCHLEDPNDAKLRCRASTASVVGAPFGVEFTANQKNAILPHVSNTAHYGLEFVASFLYPRHARSEHTVSRSEAPKSKAPNEIANSTQAGTTTSGLIQGIDGRKPCQSHISSKHAKLLTHCTHLDQNKLHCGACLGLQVDSRNHKLTSVFEYEGYWEGLGTND